MIIYNKKSNEEETYNKKSNEEETNISQGRWDVWIIISFMHNIMSISYCPGHFFHKRDVTNLKLIKRFLLRNLKINISHKLTNLE